MENLPKKLCYDMLQCLSLVERDPNNQTLPKHYFYIDPQYEAYKDIDLLARNNLIAIKTNLSLYDGCLLSRIMISILSDNYRYFDIDEILEEEKMLDAIYSIADDSEIQSVFEYDEKVDEIIDELREGTPILWFTVYHRFLNLAYEIENISGEDRICAAHCHQR